MSEVKKSGTTLTFLGCGNLGTAILSGVLASLSDPNQSSSTPSYDISPEQIPSNFIACVRRTESAKRIQAAVSSYGVPLTTLENENVKGVTEADAIILGCKPYMIADVLDVPGMREALKGKVLISILAGKTAQQIEDTLYPDAQIPLEDRCRVIRAMPNTAAVVRESMTIICPPTPPLSPASDSLVKWIFSRVGRLVTLPANVMDAGTALAGSAPASMALIMEALGDGAVAMGVPRAESQIMAAQVMRGAAAMVQNGEHPALVREKITTPGGCTMGGLMVLEEGGVRGTVARSVREAAVVARKLGKGTLDVNGPRP